MDYLTVFRETFYHYGNDTRKLADYKGYTEFVQSADATKIYEIDSWHIGVQGISPVSVMCASELRKYIGLKVTKRLFGKAIAFENT